MAASFQFTVVTPSYNQAAYIGQTIESVLSQRGPFTIQYIVMDGGSTDGSVDVIRKYADDIGSGQWPLQCAGVSMQWASRRDKGQSDAINRGLRMASGDVCCYLNSDDRFPKDALARAMKAFQEHPQADFIYGDGEVIDEAGQVQWTWLARPYNYRLLRSYHFSWNAFPNFIMQQATFWRRTVMQKIGYFDESMHYAMDLEYWLRAGAAGLVLTHVREKLGQFRMIAGTKSLSSPLIFWEDQLELFRRHHGAARVAKYFCFYYFNAALCNNMDLATAERESRSMFKRWEGLPETERKTMEDSARRGHRQSGLLLAMTLAGDGRLEEAAAAHRIATSGRFAPQFHYLSVLYGIRRTCGPLFRLAEGCWRVSIQWYRRVRIDYRYFEKQI